MEMVLKVCVFIGHRFIISTYYIELKLEEFLEDLINNGYYKFIVGTHGDFDKIVLKIIRRLKNKYKDIVIDLVFTSYKRLEIEVGLDYNKLKDVNTIIYPIEEIHYKKQIIISNEYMMQEADLVVAFVDEYRTDSGAFRAYKYAYKINKKVINLYDYRIKH